MILLDTNVISELMRPQPDERVARWMATHAATNLYTTSVTQAEILHGILLLPAGRRRQALEAAILEDGFAKLSPETVFDALGSLEDYPVMDGLFEVTYSDGARSLSQLRLWVAGTAPGELTPITGNLPVPDL